MQSSTRIVQFILFSSLTFGGHAVAQAAKAFSPTLRGAHELCSLTFDQDPNRPARVEDHMLPCMREIVGQLHKHPTAKLMLIGAADKALEETKGKGKNRMVEDETGEDTRYVDVAAYRAVNTKYYLTHWMGANSSRVLARTSQDSSRTLRVFLIPGDTFVDMQFPWTTHIFEDPCTIKPCSKPLEEHMHAQPRSRIGTPDEKPPIDKN